MDTVKQIAKEDDVIYWKIDHELTIKKYGKSYFSGKVAMIDLHNKCYGVYCEYGQDIIPFDAVVKLKRKS